MMPKYNGTWPCIRRMSVKHRFELWKCLTSAEKNSLNSLVLCKFRPPVPGLGHKHLPKKSVPTSWPPSPLPSAVPRQVWSCLPAWPFEWWASSGCKSGPGPASHLGNTLHTLSLFTPHLGVSPHPALTARIPYQAQALGTHLPRRRTWVRIAY